MTYKSIEFSVDTATGVARLTLNRPDKRNAVSAEVAAGVEAAVRRTENNPDIRVVILTSSQDKVFCAGADLVTTDVWTSMGFEAENEERMRDFADWQVDADMMQVANPGAVFMHCLPARRGLEVTDGVMDGSHSIAFAQAENRLHLSKGILAWLSGKSAGSRLLAYQEGVT